MSIAGCDSPAGLDKFKGRGSCTWLRDIHLRRQDGRCRNRFRDNSFLIVQQGCILLMEKKVSIFLQRAFAVLLGRRKENWEKTTVHPILNQRSSSPPHTKNEKVEPVWKPFKFFILEELKVRSGSFEAFAKPRGRKEYRRKLRYCILHYLPILEWYGRYVRLRNIFSSSLDHFNKCKK